ncbi:aldo/keto reductase [Sphingobacterium pedocola]|uniref:Aldo/keto reductase n=1 Tax=Sphingobacterium pedocola TaxID=2082722 RepID=A0ABR9T8H3_9SPHI|nr:aldo/keto reductase [Sphingobacterium pedocola]MBE8721641.1 aldo/keto reductase [Sphingobacterium pedocola]
MKTRIFRGTNISEIGLGTWQLGSQEWGAVEKDRAFEILATYVNSGGNFIDTADIYGGGVSERIIGEFLQQYKGEPIHVATKLGRRSDGANGWPQNFTRDEIRRHIEESLKRLNVNQLFLEQLHCIPKDELLKGDVFDYLRDFQTEGLIKHWGVSVETTDEALICLAQEGLGSLQVIFNLFRQHIADEIFTKAKSNEVSLIARVPLASGLLTGKFKTDTQFAESDHRNFNADGQAFNVGETFSGLQFNQGLAFVEKIKQYAPQEITLSQFALQWILSYPEITSVIPGASSPNQVLNNIGASVLPTISEQTLASLRTLYFEEIKPKIRGEY